MSLWLEIDDSDEISCDESNTRSYETALYTAGSDYKINSTDVNLFSHSSSQINTANIVKVKNLKQANSTEAVSSVLIPTISVKNVSTDFGKSPGSSTDWKKNKYTLKQQLKELHKNDEKITDLEMAVPQGRQGKRKLAYHERPEKAAYKREISRNEGWHFKEGESKTQQMTSSEWFHYPNGDIHARNYHVNEQWNEQKWKPSSSLAENSGKNCSECYKWQKTFIGDGQTEESQQQLIKNIDKLQLSGEEPNTIESDEDSTEKSREFRFKGNVNNIKIKAMSVKLRHHDVNTSKEEEKNACEIQNVNLGKQRTDLYIPDIDVYKTSKHDCNRKIKQNKFQSGFKKDKFNKTKALETSILKQGKNVKSVQLICLKSGPEFIANNAVDSSDMDIDSKQQAYGQKEKTSSLRGINDTENNFLKHRVRGFCDSPYPPNLLSCESHHEQEIPVKNKMDLKEYFSDFNDDFTMECIDNMSNSDRTYSKDIDEDDFILKFSAKAGGEEKQQQQNVHEVNNTFFDFENVFDCGEQYNNDNQSNCDSCRKHISNSVLHKCDEYIDNCSVIKLKNNEPNKDLRNWFVDIRKEHGGEDNSYKDSEKKSSKMNPGKNPKQHFSLKDSIYLETNIKQKSTKNQQKYHDEKPYKILKCSRKKVFEPLENDIMDQSSQANDVINCNSQTNGRKMSITNGKFGKYRNDLPACSSCLQQRTLISDELCKCQSKVMDGQDTPLIRYDTGKDQISNWKGNILLSDAHNHITNNVKTDQEYLNEIFAQKGNSQIANYSKSTTTAKQIDDEVKTPSNTFLNSSQCTLLNERPLAQRMLQSKDYQSEKCPENCRLVDNSRYCSIINDKIISDFHKSMHEDHQSDSKDVTSKFICDIKDDFKYPTDKCTCKDEEVVIGNVARSNEDLKISYLKKIATYDPSYKEKCFGSQRSINCKEFKTCVGNMPKNEENGVKNLGIIKSDFLSCIDKQKKLFDYGMQISNSVASSHLAKQLCLSMFNEWMSERGVTIALLRKVIDNIRKSEEWYTTFIQNWVDGTQESREVTEAPAEICRKDDGFAKSLKRIWNKFSGNGYHSNTLQVSDISVPNVRKILIKDMMITDEFQMYILQCVTQFRETLKYIKNFRESIIKDFLCDSFIYEAFQTFMMTIVKSNPEDNFFCRKVSKAYEELNLCANETNMPTNAYKAFCEFLKQDLSVLQTIGCVNWKQSQSFVAFSEMSANDNSKCISNVIENLSSWTKSKAIENISQTLEVLVSQAKIFENDMVCLL